MNRDEAFAELMGSCPSFAAAGSGAEYAASFEDTGQPDAFIRTEALAHHVVALAGRRDVEEVGWLAGAVERVLAEGDDDAVELVSLGFLEPLRNIVSHEDVAVGAAQLADLLGSGAGRLLAENEQLWEDAARWRSPGRGGAVAPAIRLGAEDYEGVGHPELRRYLQAHKRRMPDGALLGAPDVVRYQHELANLSAVRPAGGGRVPWAVLALLAALVAAAVIALVR